MKAIGAWFIAAVIGLAAALGLYNAGIASYDLARSDDWVLVKAEAINPAVYRYAFRGATHTSVRLGPGHRSGHAEEELEGVAEQLAEAFQTHKPFTVYVNPDRPSESLIVRDLSWLTLAGKFFGSIVMALLAVGIVVLARRRGDTAKPTARRDRRKGAALT